MTAWRDADYLVASGLNPFDPALVNPCSVDLRLGNTLRRPHKVWQMTEYELRNLTRGIVPRRWTMAGGLPAGVDPVVLEVADPIAHLPKWGEPVEFDRTWLYPDEFVLCHSMETVTVPDDTIALLFSKSSTGRLGLEHLHCLTGDSLIDTPRDLRKYPNGIPLRELSDREFLTYAYDIDSMCFVLTPARAFPAKQGVKAVRVTYQWKSYGKLHENSLVCTPDHRLLTLNRKWVEAQNSEGARLLPFSRGLDHRYAWITPFTLRKKVIREHRFVVDQVFGLIPGYEVHHINRNPIDNRIENLELFERGLHQSLHSKGAENPFYGKKHTEETRRIISEKRTGKLLTPEHKKKLSEILGGTGNPRYVDVPLGTIVSAYTEGGGLEGAAEIIGVHSGTLLRKIKEYGFRGAVDFRHKIASMQNHKVVRVEDVSEPQDTYDIVVPDYENFVANGVVVHNSGLGDSGFSGNWTWELHNVAPWPIELVAGARIMQQIYINLTGVPERTYRETGRYQNQSGPTPARPARS